MDAPFTEGLPYLSRDEESQAEARLLGQQQRLATLADINVKDTDLESVKFLKDVRGQIDEWIAMGNVSVPGAFRLQPISLIIHRGKRNASIFSNHQLIRAVLK